MKKEKEFQYQRKTTNPYQINTELKDLFKSIEYEESKMNRKNTDVKDQFHNIKIKENKLTSNNKPTLSNLNINNKEASDKLNKIIHSTKNSNHNIGLHGFNTNTNRKLDSRNNNKHYNKPDNNEIIPSFRNSVKHTKHSIDVFKDKSKLLSKNHNTITNSSNANNTPMNKIYNSNSHSNINVTSNFNNSKRIFPISTINKSRNNVISNYFQSSNNAVSLFNKLPEISPTNNTTYNNSRTHTPNKLIYHKSTKLNNKSKFTTSSNLFDNEATFNHIKHNKNINSVNDIYKYNHTMLDDSFYEELKYKYKEYNNAKLNIKNINANINNINNKENKDNKVLNPIANSNKEIINQQINVFLQDKKNHNSTKNPKLYKFKAVESQNFSNNGNNKQKKILDNKNIVDFNINYTNNVNNNLESIITPINVFDTNSCNKDSSFFVDNINLIKECDMDNDKRKVSRNNNNNVIRNCKVLKTMVNAAPRKSLDKNTNKFNNKYNTIKRNTVINPSNIIKNPSTDKNKNNAQFDFSSEDGNDKLKEGVSKLIYNYITI